MKQITSSVKCSSKTLLIGSIALMISASAFAQSVFQWQQGGRSSDWGDAGNWGGSVFFNNNETFSFYRHVTRLNNFLGDENRHIGTLRFESHADRDVSIRFTSRATGTGSRQLVMSNTTPTIIVEWGASGNFDLGAGFGTLAFVNGDLNIDHNGTGNLILSAAHIGAIGGSSRGLLLSGTGTLQISGGANYTGNTQINGGTLQLLNGGYMTFVLGGSGVNTHITGAAGTKALFDGEFVFLLDNAATALNSSWAIVAGSVEVSYGPNFSIRDFVNAGGGTWVRAIDNQRQFKFSEATGSLEVVRREGGALPPAAQQNRPPSAQENRPPSAQENRPSLMYVGDFEARNSLDRIGDSGIEDTLRKVARVTDPVRYGNYALRVTLDRLAEDDPKPYRTDFWIRGLSGVYQMDEEYWFGFSTFLPENFEMDPQGELFVQWINPDILGSPSLAIYIYQDTYQMRKRWGERNTNVRTIWQGQVWEDLGQWADWVVRVLWSDGPDGIVEMWKNGQLMVSEAGPNTDRAGGRAPYFKFGIYKWPWIQSMEETPSFVTQRVMYFDEIRIGNTEAGFDGVAPPMRKD